MKKIKTLLLVVLCLFGLTACASNEKPVVPDDVGNYLAGSSIVVIEQFMVPIESADRYDEYANKSAEELEVLFGQLMKVNGNGILTGLDSWHIAASELGNFVGLSAEPELGSLESVDGWYTAEYNTAGDQIIINIPCKFENREANIEFVYDTDYYMTLESCATNINYTFKEKMAKAGLNTLLGMGTVFAVLILICLIISLFGFIPVIEKAFKKENKETKAPVENVISQIAEKEELSDDLELIAVITAAIAASENNASTDGFVVRSIRRR